MFTVFSVSTADSAHALRRERRKEREVEGHSGANVEDFSCSDTEACDVCRAPGRPIMGGHRLPRTLSGVASSSRRHLRSTFESPEKVTLDDDEHLQPVVRRPCANPPLSVVLQVLRLTPSRSLFHMWAEASPTPLHFGHFHVGERTSLVWTATKGFPLWGTCLVYQSVSLSVAQSLLSARPSPFPLSFLLPVSAP